MNEKKIDIWLFFRYNSVIILLFFYVIGKKWKLFCKIKILDLLKLWKLVYNFRGMRFVKRMNYLFILFVIVIYIKKRKKENK